MAITKELKQYETRPVQVWGKMKEMRRKHFRHIWQAHDKGELITVGMSESFMALPAGMGNYAASSYGPFFTGIMRDRAQAIRVSEVTEARGYGHEVCCAMRVHMGQVFLGMTTKSPLNGDTVVPDFVFQPNFCINAGKCGAFLSDYLDIPMLVIDIPFENTENNRQYLFDQLLTGIEWMEKTTGRKYDDEKFIQATRNEWETTVLFTKICCLNKTVPAPLDARHMMSLRQPIFSMRHQEETVEFYRELLAETEERVRDGVSARGFELARLSFEPGVPFFFPNLYRFPEKYGAITVVCEEYAAGAFTAWNVTPDGEWTAATPPWERGNPMRTREDAVWAQVDLGLTYHRTHNIYKVDTHIPDPLTRAKDWKVNGVVFHIIRGCRAIDSHVAEAKLLVDHAGIPNTIYEGSHA
ncbi:MAG: 2-hydroxyacyl-CoA dehydratase family protein, partial [Dehalococcoidia bacterium]|nr:2-hydroxyacyl-CoA dehydratase family protein [Dehalococcoidia bacterium]